MVNNAKPNKVLDIIKQNVRNTNGKKLLKECEEFDTESALVLLKDNSLGCTLKYTNDDNKTTLILACENNMKEVALEILAQFSQNPSLFCCSLGHIGNDSYTAFMFACKNRMEEVCMEMLKNPNCCALSHTNTNNVTPLMFACYNNMNKVALKMLDTPYICSLSVFNKNGNTALILACRNKMEMVCLKMLDYHTEYDLSHENNMFIPETHTPTYKYTAFKWAKRNNMETVCDKIKSIFEDDKSKKKRRLNDDK